ncbi:MAG: cation-translocating P-type ATPase [Tissierellia bacterium]|nr:cation-translocating P-type ATPase [Tissierellia bacterium]
MTWYRKDRGELKSTLKTDFDKGLSEGEVKTRLDRYGFNELQEEKGRGALFKILSQFNDFLVIILILASIVSFLMGERTDALVILAIVMINALLGLYQEGKAEQAMEALKKMSAPNAKVIRDGVIKIVPANTLVPGDIVLLESGDIVPGDLRLLEGSNLKIEEASLTGESVPADKEATAVFDGSMPLGDRRNMAYMSTIVISGRGRGVVVDTANHTEIGKIATMIQTFEEDATPLQNRLDQLGKHLGIACILACTLVFVIGFLQGRDLLSMFMIAISLAVAAIPEGLPAIVTIVLALGMNRMVKRHAIVKKLLAVETLGCTTTICSDKTGTLTQNEMTVVKAYVDNRIIDITGTGYEPVGEFKAGDISIVSDELPTLNTLITMALLCNDAILDEGEGSYEIIGDPTEGSLLSLAGKAGLFKDDIEPRFPRIAENPFDSDRKMMTTFHEGFIPNGVVSFTKGALDSIISRCDSIYIDGNHMPLSEELKDEIFNMNSTFSMEALRVLAFAFREHPDIPMEDINTWEMESNMTFVGLVGMIDPPREEAKIAIAQCKEAGIKTVMITGDYRETAFAIGRQLGMVEEEQQIMTGAELDDVSDLELRKLVKYKRVYTRVTPKHKVRIIDALKSNGEIVAMTGDGVNDALALKRSDIGVAMGITGTDVAKNTAEIILTDDNFASIVAAVEEGRIIYSNIKKFVLFLLSCNIGEILIILLSILFNLPVPLIPIQLLWLNLVTDSFPALALGIEKGEPGIMSIPPRDPDEPILDRRMIISIAIQSLSIGLASLLAYRWGLRMYGVSNLLVPRTVTFATLITAELLRAYSSRSQDHTIFEIGILTNRSLVYATVLSFILLLMVIYIPFLQPIFHTYPLALNHWGIILLYASIPLIIGEAYKVFFRG